SLPRFTVATKLASARIPKCLLTACRVMSRRAQSSFSVWPLSARKPAGRGHGLDLDAAFGRDAVGLDLRSFRARRTGKARSSPPLIGWCVDDQSIERFSHLDLAGEARGRLHLEGGVELLFFFLRGQADDRKPFFIDMHQAGGAGA